jgi:aminoglycoside phosphotransferase family enzyme/predicted kinase
VVTPAASDTGAAVRETHVGVVFLLCDRAYKLKKPVRTGFLDFSTAQLRCATLRRELELNRRLAPDVYLGVTQVPDPVDPAAAPEPLLVMRRMPADRRLATLVQDGAPVDGPLRDLARLMAVFHARAERSDRIAAEGGRDALRRRWTDNIAQTRAFRETVLDAAAVDAVDELALRFLDGRGSLFADRRADDRIVDGHGDLIADDVFCLDDGPRVLDCLEFDDLLRYVDVLDDVAFLAMDLERLGRPELATRFLDAYVEFSGDPAPVSLRHHYIAYRAFVRAKVACLRHEQGDPGAAGIAVQDADLAIAHLRAGAVRLALVGGLPGTGKTTIAGGLADRFGAVLLSSDRVRKELAGLDPATSATANFGEGLYTPERTDALYSELLHRAAELLARGESVVLDASWTSARHRHAAEKLAHDTHSDLVALRCHTSPETAAHRIRTRGPTASDATAAVATAMAATADPWPEAVDVDTTGSIEQSAACAASAW